MGEYKRLISYIYSYRRGVKGKNAGFAKIESRNEVCKVNISLRIADELMNETEDNMLEVFFFYREKEKIKKIFLDRIRIANGCSMLKLRMNSDNIGNKDVSLSQICGIIICSHAFLSRNSTLNIIYASEWDDIPIVAQDFIDDEDTYGYNNAIAQEKVMLYNEGEILEASEVKQYEDKDIEDALAGVKVDNNSSEEDDLEKKNDKSEQNIIYGEEESQVDNEDDFIAAATMSQHDVKANYFKILCSCYPKVKLNEIDGECIKITPHDISYLPKRFWALCNNSFLLHGYNNYKYLILCKKNVDGKVRYVIGVPGLFHQKEQMIARMFGFTEFEGNKRAEAMNFGYWCMYLSE